MQNILHVNHLSFRYKDKLIIDSISLEVAFKDILVIVGPSGCGKSTLLRLISHLEKPLSGSITLNSEKSTMRYLFQDYDAFPWFTVFENVKVSLPKKRSVSNEDIDILLDKLGILESKNKYPKELSIGMRKRLGLARCLIAKPAMLLLDEPFSALDVDTKLDVYGLLQELYDDFQQTIILVTHNIEEAIFLGKKVLVATSLPFRIKSIIDIPFDYPRTDSIYSDSNFQLLMNGIRNNVSSFPAAK